MSGWQRFEIAGKGADVFIPSAPVRFALLFLHPHGDGTLASPQANPAFTDALAAADLACCCPMASRTWWCDRVYPPFDEMQTAERFLLDCVEPWMRRTWLLPERAVALAGISMGGQGALRLAFKYAERFPVVAGIASAVDYHQEFDNPQFCELPQLYRNREHCRQDTATLHVKQNSFPRHIWFACDPHDMDWFPGNDRLHEKLRAVGVPHMCDLETSQGCHSWEYYNAMAKPMLTFVQAALKKESRRVMSLPTESLGCE